MLETRCLLSGWPLSPGPHRPSAVERPASDVDGIPKYRPDAPLAQPAQSGKLSQPQAARTHETLDAVDPGGTTGRPDDTPGLAALPQDDDYVFIPESSTPHHTLASAQALPELPYFGVVGTLGASDEIDLYRLTLDEIPDRIDFGLVTQGWGTNVPVTFQLLDGSGQVLGTWKLGSLGGSSIQVNLENMSPGSTLYLGISGGNASAPGGAIGTLGYQLWVALQPSVPLTSAPTGVSAQSILSLPVVSPLVLPLATVGLSSVQGNYAALLTAPQSASATANVTFGSLALRSAEASRGLLSNDEPAPFAAQGRSTSAPGEVVALSTARTESEGGGETLPGEAAVSGRDPEASVVVNSTGGFPLMSATAVGYWRRQEAHRVSGPGTTEPAMEERSKDPESTGIHDLASRLTESLAEEAVSSRGQSFRIRAWGGFPVSVFSGLGAATVLTLNAVFSQPLAGYDYLAARLYRSGIRATTRRGPSK